MLLERMMHYKTILIIFFIAYASCISAQSDNDTINQTDQDGNKTGYWKKINDEGLLLYEGQFDHGIPIGEFTYFYPDGIVKARTVFSDEGIHAATTTYHHSGEIMSEGLYIKQEKDSLWRYYDNTGTLLKEEFYRNQEKSGTWKTFYENGQVAELTSWENGKQQGPWEQYFSDGLMKASGNFVDDEKQGPFDYYYPNGRLRVTGSYVDSYKTGDWFYMDEEGKVIKKEVYKEGRIINSEEYE